MALVTMTYTHLFLGILLVSLIGLGGARRPCPINCVCTWEILNCSSINNLPRFHQAPLPKLGVHPHPFTYLDFTGNAISSIGKEVWNAYPWAEYLVLKNNSLSRLKNSSLEGLLSLTYLDLSYNKIQVIEMNAFEAVPFLQIISLSGNSIGQITEGMFRAWHGMQFLLQVDLSHNPLSVIQDSSFYHLPLLKFLDLGATEVMPGILEDLVQNSPQLSILILPKKMSCCLCHIKEDIEVVCETIKLECTESCGINATQCKKEEPLNRMQEDVMQVLETRKWNGGRLLHILPPNNEALERTKSNNDTSAQGFGAHILTMEELRNLLQYSRNHTAEDDKSEISVIDSELSLNKLPPDIMLSQGTYWKHHRTSASPPLDFSTHQDVNLLQGDLFETELNKTLASLIPNAPVRKLISHVIHILKMDCTAPALQMACSKVVSRSGLLMKLVSENMNETSSLWNSYFWHPKKVANMTKGISRKLEKPSDVVTHHETSRPGYGNKLLLAISVTATIMIITAIICLIEIWSRCSIIKGRAFRDKRKKLLLDEELSRTPSLVIYSKPLWLKDLYHIQDETEQHNLVVKLHDEESLEEVDRGHWGYTRPSLLEPTMKEISSDPSFVSTLEVLTASPAVPPPSAPPSPYSTPSQKPSMKKGSDTAGGISEATSSKAAISAVEEGGDDETEEGFADKSETPITAATSEVPESGEVVREEGEEGNE